ncbi:MAG: hypothetical protein ACRDL7_01740, partial [Gaiellaceae bacterium]
MEQQWSFKYAPIVEELNKKPIPLAYIGTIRAQPDIWTLDTWRQVYNLDKGSEGMATKADVYTKSRFARKPHKKDGYRVKDCIDRRERRVLAFLTPIFHPDRPNRLTVTLASTLVSSYAGTKEVSWSKLVRDLVLKLKGGLEHIKSSPLCPFLFHLYQRHGVLLPMEAQVWKTQEERRKKGEPDSEPELGEGDEDSEEDATTDEEASLPTPLTKKRKRVKNIASKEPLTRPKDTRGTSSALKNPVITGCSLVPDFDKFRTKLIVQESLLQSLENIVGCDRSNLIATTQQELKKPLANHQEVKQLTTEVAKL